MKDSMNINTSKQTTEILIKALTNRLGEFRKQDEWFKVCSIDNLGARRDGIYGLAIDFTENIAQTLVSEKDAKGVVNKTGIEFAQDEIFEGAKYVAGYALPYAFGDKLEKEIQRERQRFVTKLNKQIADDFDAVHSSVEKDENGNVKSNKIYQSEFVAEYDRLSQQTKPVEVYSFSQKDKKYYPHHTTITAGPQDLSNKLEEIDEIAEFLVKNVMDKYTPKYAVNQDLVSVVRQGLVQDTVRMIRQNVLTSEEKRETTVLEGQEKYQKQLALLEEQRAAAEKAHQERLANDPTVKFAKEIDDVCKKLSLIENDLRRDHETYVAAEKFMTENGLLERAKSGASKAKKIDGSHTMFYQAQQEQNDFYYDYFKTKVNAYRQQILAGREQSAKQKEQAALIKRQNEEDAAYAEDMLRNADSEDPTEVKLDALTDHVMKEVANPEADKNQEMRFALAEATQILGGDEEAKEVAKHYFRYLERKIARAEEERTRIENGRMITVLEDGTELSEPIDHKDVIEPEGVVKPIIKEENPVAPANQKEVVKKHSSWKKGLAIGLGVVLGVTAVVGGVLGITAWMDGNKQQGDNPTNFANLGAADANKVAFVAKADKDKDYILTQFDVKEGTLNVDDKVKNATTEDQEKYAKSFGDAFASGAADKLADVANLKNDTAAVSLATGLDARKFDMVYVSENGNFYDSADFKAELKEAGFTDAQVETVIDTYDANFEKYYSAAYDESKFEHEVKPNVNENRDFESLFAGNESLVNNESVQYGRVQGNRVDVLTEQHLFSWTLDGVNAEELENDELLAQIARAETKTQSDVFSDAFMTSWTQSREDGTSIVSKAKMDEINNKVKSQFPGATKVVLAGSYETKSEGNYNGIDVTLNYVGVDENTGKIVDVIEGKEGATVWYKGNAANAQAVAYAMTYVNQNGGELKRTSDNGTQYGYGTKPFSVSLGGKSKE